MAPAICGAVSLLRLVSRLFFASGSAAFSDSRNRVYLGYGYDDVRKIEGFRAKPLIKRYLNYLYRPELQLKSGEVFPSAMEVAEHRRNSAGKEGT
jgi:hypothetical protein